MAYTEAFERVVSGMDRIHSRDEDVDLCIHILDSWSKYLKSLTEGSAVPVLGTNRKDPLTYFKPSLSETVTRLGCTTPVKHAEMSFSREQLDILSKEKSFISGMCRELLPNGGPVRFGFLRVYEPETSEDNFSKLAGREASGDYEGKLNPGRYFCLLTHEKLVFTSVNFETSDAKTITEVPLLWIRKLDAESKKGCFMKFTRYLTRPSPETELESRVIVADTSLETYNWMADITRAFTVKKSFETN